MELGVMPPEEKTEIEIQQVSMCLVYNGNEDFESVA